MDSLVKKVGNLPVQILKQ